MYSLCCLADRYSLPSCCTTDDPQCFARVVLLGEMPRPTPRIPVEIKTRPSPNDAHDVVYFRRHRQDDPAETIPGRTAMEGWPVKVRPLAMAVLAQVAAAPPTRFSGGGYWEAMKKEMTGWFEVRVNGPNRHHYRLYCLLDYEANGRAKPLLVVVDGRDKKFRTELPAREYTKIKALGREYVSRNPRSIA